MHARLSPRPFPQRNEANSWKKLLVLSVSILLPGVIASAAPNPQQFLAWFWKRPLLSQGGPYVIEGEQGHPLAPETCGHCHEQQLQDWRNSRHAQALGPGVLGQFLDRAQKQIQECLNCHAPLREQADSLQKAWTKSSGPGAAGSPFQTRKSLHSHGVLCSGCHVRNYRWYGPPRTRDLSTPNSGSVAPHEGCIPEKGFEDPRFCAACHQFPAGGYALNGKLIENTYEEWKASPYAAGGLTCQGCHMPGRRHLWRGIHDPETVRSAVNIGVSTVSVVGRMLAVDLSLTNSGTGHFFPTYVTPSVVLDVYQEGADGAMAEGTDQRLVIAREISLDLSTEYSDTRLSPGQTAVLEYRRPRSLDAVLIVMKVYVQPDAFYGRFFQALLETDLSENSRALIGQALAESNRSAFVIFEDRYEIAAALRLPVPAGPESDRHPGGR
jgi:hypothetical protein